MNMTIIAGLATRDAEVKKSGDTVYAKYSIAINRPFKNKEEREAAKAAGKDTADFIDTVMSRITLPGSLFIAFIAIMPALASLLNVQDAFSQFFGGTSLLILVGVVLDTLAQIESHLLMRHYDGLLSSGRIHGRGMAAY